LGEDTALEEEQTEDLEEHFGECLRMVRDCWLLIAHLGQSPGFVSRNHRTVSVDEVPLRLNIARPEAVPNSAGGNRGNVNNVPCMM
jgi:hypothetical protein